MVKQEAVLLCSRAGIANDVDDGNVFRISSCNSIDCGKLAHTERGDNSRNAFHTCIAIGGVSGVQLIAISDPVKAGRFDVV